MPQGRKQTEPQDRRVIIIASYRDLQRCAARAAASRTRETTPSFALLPKAAVEWVLSASALFGMRHWSTDEVLKQVEKELQLGMPIALYGQAEAIRLFRFGVGHTPKSGSVYVQHPILHDYYIAPESFTRVLAKEKEAAFRQLASSLGAKELRLISADVRTKKGWLDARVNVSEIASQLGLCVETDNAGALVSRVYSRFGKPKQPPQVPDDLRQWVEMDADLRTMARDRTEGHLLQTQVTLEFQERMGAGGDVAAQMARCGIIAAGSYEALHHSVWNFEAEYWPLDE